MCHSISQSETAFNHKIQIFQIILKCVIITLNTHIYILMDTIRRFAHEHDDLPAFHAAYLVLTMLAAAMFNMGVFALLIVAHMSLDLVKYRELHGMPWRSTVEGIMRESLIDITLLLVGLVFGVYLHHSVGIAGLSGLLRAEVTIIRALGTMIPKMTILHDFLKVISHLNHYMRHVHPHFRDGYTGVERACFFFLGIAFTMLIFAIPILNLTVLEYQNILADQLVPWNI